MRMLLSCAMAALVTGCGVPDFAPEKSNPETERLRQEGLKHPIGRFVVFRRHVLVSNREPPPNRYQFPGGRAFPELQELQDGVDIIFH